MKIIVASKNPVKIDSVKEAFLQLGDEDTQICSAAVCSGVPDQPVGSSQTLNGARNRVQELVHFHPGHQFFIGIEGGVEWIEHRLFAMAWVVISDGHQEGIARSSSFELPSSVVALIQQGMELGVADDVIFNEENSKQKTGAIGLLSHNLITRGMLYVPAVLMALFPFRNSSLYVPSEYPVV